MEVGESALNPSPDHELLCFLPLENPGHLEKWGTKFTAQFAI